MGELEKALVAVQLVITNAPTNTVNPYFKSKYTDLATAVNHCRPILAEHGLAIIQTFDGPPEAPVIVTRLLHTSGEYIEGRLAMKPVKADPQSIGSLLTYGRRYSYLAMVGIAPEDDDANSAMPVKPETKKEEKKPDGPEQWTTAQRGMLWSKCKEKGMSETEAKAFIEKYNPGKDKTTASSMIDNFEQLFSDYTGGF